MESFGPAKGSGLMTGMYGISGRASLVEGIGTASAVCIGLRVRRRAAESATKAASLAALVATGA